MLEIYTLGLKQTQLQPLLGWLKTLDVDCTVLKAPREPEKMLSAYVEASYLQTGLELLPLPDGHMRLLLTNYDAVGPQVGQCAGKKMIATGVDNSSRAVTAIHELGHAFNVINSKRTCVADISAKPEFLHLAVQEKTDLINELAKGQHDATVMYQGLHCFNDCIMRPGQDSISLAHRSPLTFFCAMCFEQFKVSNSGTKKRAAKTAAKQAKRCGDCKHLRDCMFAHSYIWEDATACGEFEAE